MSEQDEEMPDVLFKATIGGKRIKKWHTRIPAEMLVIEPYTVVEVHALLEKEISSLKDMSIKENIEQLKGSLKEPIKIYVFSMPIEAYMDLDKEIHVHENRNAQMGEFTRLIVPGETKTVSLQLETDYIYDIFGFSGTTFIGGGRLSTGDGEVSGAITLEEMKLFALMDLGIDIDQAKNVTAKVIPMNAWGMSGRIVIAGFRLDTENEGSSSDHTIMVTHMCRVSYSHDYSKEDLLPFFK